MLYPTIDQLTKDEFNRYELALATAKCARMLTDEYVEKKDAIEKAAVSAKDVDRNLINALNKEYREEKAVKNAISRIHDGSYKIVREAAAEATEVDSEADVEQTVAEEN